MNTVSQATDIKRGPLQRSKLEYFGTIDNGFQLLTIVVELSILNICGVGSYLPLV